MMRIVVGLAFLALSGCVTPTNYLLLESTPAGAQLKFPDGSICETPCPVTLVEDLKVTVAKAGYIAQEWRLSAGQIGVIRFELELAAPTTSVEETVLPDL